MWVDRFERRGEIFAGYFVVDVDHGLAWPWSYLCLAFCDKGTAPFIICSCDKLTVIVEIALQEALHIQYANTPRDLIQALRTFVDP